MSPRKPRSSGWGKGSSGRSPKRRLGVALRLAVVLSVVVAAGVIYLYVEITERFEGRLWTFPSRIYSDTLVLTHVAYLERGALVRQLDRCGYARSDAEPVRPGQYRVRGDSLDVHTRGIERAENPVAARRLSATRNLVVTAHGARRKETPIFAPRKAEKPGLMSR